MEKEKIYDTQISPLMTQIIEIAQANHIDFIASFELGLVKDKDYDEDDRGVVPLHCSTYINDAKVPRLIFMDMARQADLNMDALILGLIRYGREHGNQSSILMQKLGVPLISDSQDSEVK